MQMNANEHPQWRKSTEVKQNAMQTLHRNVFWVTRRTKSHFQVLVANTCKTFNFTVILYAFTYVRDIELN